MLLHGEELGIPVVLIDCRGREEDSWPLTALCTHSPDIVESFVSSEAADIARSLSGSVEQQLGRLRRELSEWQLGFESIRTAVLEDLRRIWHEPKTSLAKIGQDAAGGGRANLIERARISDALTQWWSIDTDAPALVVGRDGAGKAWASLSWIVDCRHRL